MCDSDPTDVLQANDPCELLLLPIRHDTNHLKLADGMRLSEPPAIEGFLHRLTGLKGVPTKRRVFVHSQAGERASAARRNQGPDLFFLGCLLSSSPQKSQSPLAPYHHPVNDERIRDAYFADERIRNTHNMLFSDGLIDFRTIVRLQPPKGSDQSPFERPGQTDQEKLLEDDEVRTTLARLTEAQFLVVLASKEVIWLEVGGQAERLGTCS